MLTYNSFLMQLYHLVHLCPRGSVMNTTNSGLQQHKLMVMGL